MKNAWIVVPLLLSSACADAQILPSGKPSTAGKSTDPLNRDLPQSSVVAFLEAAHAHNYAKAWRYLDLRKMPEEERLADGVQLAGELETVLDRDTQFDVGNLSREPDGDTADNLAPNRDRVATFHVNGQTLELDLERVTLHSGLSVWLFSSDSVARIPIVAQLTNNAVIEGICLFRW
jgi:MscS family membrane protein